MFYVIKKSNNSVFLEKNYKIPTIMNYEKSEA